MEEILFWKNILRSSSEETCKRWNNSKSYNSLVKFQYLSLPQCDKRFVIRESYEISKSQKLNAQEKSRLLILLSRCIERVFLTSFTIIWSTRCRWSSVCRKIQDLDEGNARFPCFFCRFCRQFECEYFRASFCQALARFDDVNY